MTDFSIIETATQLLGKAGEQMQTASRTVNQALQLIGAPPIEEANRGDDSLETLALTARQLIKARRTRDHAFGLPDLFGEPAWEILLDLFVAKADGSRVSVSSACAASTAPHTTALRYLKALEDHSMIRRTPHETDARIVYVTLSEKAITSMTALLTRV